MPMKCRFCGSEGVCFVPCNCALCTDWIRFRNWWRNAPGNWRDKARFDAQRRMQLEVNGQSTFKDAVASRNKTIQDYLKSRFQQRCQAFEQPLEKTDMLRFTVEFLRELTVITQKLKESVEEDYLS